MIKLNEEYFDSRYYFLLREKKDGGHLWFSVSTTLAEAREQDDYVKFPKDMVNRVQKYLDKLVKIKKPKTQKEVKSVSYVVRRYSDIQDDKINVSDEEVKAYFEEHKNEKISEK